MSFVLAVNILSRVRNIATYATASDYVSVHVGLVYLSHIKTGQMKFIKMNCNYLDKSALNQKIIVNNMKYIVKQLFRNIYGNFVIYSP